MTKIVLKLPLSSRMISVDIMNSIARKISDFLEHDPVLVMPADFDISFISNDLAAELQETVDEIWVYKVKKKETGNGVN